MRFAANIFGLHEVKEFKSRNAAMRYMIRACDRPRGAEIGIEWFSPEWTPDVAPYRILAVSRDDRPVILGWIDPIAEN